MKFPGELHGKPRRTWGHGPDNPARNLRESIARALVHKASTAQAIDICRWFLDKEIIAAFQAKAIEAVAKSGDPEADKLAVELVCRPHPNAEVLAMALRICDDRKLNVAADKLGPLCQAPRTSIREAARKLSDRLGLPKPGPFDPAAAVRLPKIREIIEQITRMVVTTSPADADFVTIRFSNERDDMLGDSAVRGWLLKETPDDYVVLTPHGWKESVPKKIAAQKDQPPPEVKMEKVSL